MTPDQLRRLLVQAMMGGGGASGLQGALRGVGLSLGARSRGIGPDARNAALPQFGMPLGMAAAGGNFLPPGILQAINRGNPGALQNASGQIGGSVAQGNSQAAYNPAPGGGLSTGLGGAMTPAPPVPSGSPAAPTDPAAAFYAPSALYRRLFETGRGDLIPYLAGSSVTGGSAVMM